MTVQVERLDKVKVVLTIEVPEERFAAAVAEAYKVVAPKISIDGFRKGKAPKKIIEKVYGPGVFYEEAVERLIPREYVEAVKEVKETSDIQPIGRPNMDIVQLEEGKPFIFTATVDTKQEVTLGEYKGVEVQSIDGEVKEEEMMQYIDNIRGKNAPIDTVSDENATVENGDIVNLNFLGKKDGVPFPGGAGEDFDLTIGSGQFIPGFEEQMVGMKVGEERSLDITFPEAYHAADLAGQAVVFDVKVNGIKRKQLAELNDEFAKDVSEFETLEEYKADVKEMLTKQKADAILMKYKNYISEKVTEDADVLAPESMVEAEAENYLNDIRYNMKQQGIELEQYLELTNGSIDDVKADCTAKAEAFVKQRITLEAIAEKESIELTDEELDAEFAKMAEMYGQPADQIKQIFTMQGQLANIKRNLHLEKVMNFLLENAKIG